MILALLAISCTALLPPGPHELQCTAEYLHDGGYVATAYSGHYGSALVECSGEGHPARVTLRSMGEVVCMEEEVLFADNFDSGDLNGWDYATP
jgi:hypothetical protein